jgi:hypothetical protein
MTTAGEKWASQYQALPTDLAGRSVFVLGGGPSLRSFDARCLDGRLVVVTNEAFQIKPDSHALVFVDIHWWQRRREDVLAAFRGRVVGRGPYDWQYRKDGVTGCGYRREEYWSQDPRILGGKNSGLAAINAAALMGAKRIFLLGFDMQQTGGRSNFHRLHPAAETKQNRYADLFLPEFARAAKRIEQLGRPVVINCTPGTALKCFPERTLEWVLQEYPE